MVSWRRLLHNSFALVCFLFLFYTVSCFVLFVSSQDETWTGLPSDVHVLRSIRFRLFVNILLLMVYVIQHSFMASSAFKDFFGEPSIVRSLYVSSTSIALQVLMNLWQTIPEITLWRINTRSSVLLWSMFFIVHLILWTSVYGVSIRMDFFELVGLKQARYSSCEVVNPLMYKSPNHRRLLEHMRHPSFSCICALLYFRPVMTIDRLFLAVFFTLYMAFRFQVDTNDYEYLKCQTARKLSRLRHNIYPHAIAVELQIK